MNTYDKELNQIKQGNPKNVYICFGSEQYLLEQFIRRLEDALIAPEQKDMAVTQYQIKETSVDDILEDAETLPFLAERKLIVAHDAVFFTGAKASAKVEHNLDRLLAYMKQPVDYTVLLFIVNGEKLDERKKIVKEARKSAAVLKFEPLQAEEVPRWLRMQAQLKNCALNEEAERKFILYTGANLLTMDTELEKLALYAGSETEITSDMVEQLVVRSSEQNVFILIDCIVRRQFREAFRILQELLQQKEEPIKIVNLIARQIRMMLMIHDLENKGFSQRQIASQISAHPYAVKIAAEQAKKYASNELLDILSRLAELDVSMKSGRVDKVMGLEMLLLGLAQKKTASH